MPAHVAGFDSVEDRAATASAERLHAEWALERSEASFRALIEHLPDGVVVHRDGKIVYSNPAALRLLGYSESEEMAGGSVFDLIHPDERPDIVKRIAEMRVTGAPLPLREERLLRRDGSFLTAEVAAVPVMFDGVPAYAAVARDLTEQKRMQAQLIQADRLANMGLLAAGVAHEINNPLGYLLLCLDRIVRELPEIGRVLDRVRAESAATLGEEAAAALFARAGAGDATIAVETLAERAGEALEGARRVGHIAHDLKSFARAGNDEQRLVDVRALMDRALDIAANELRFRARVVREYGEVPRVVANEGRLVQVFLNLIVNAAHAIDAGRPEENTVRVRTAADAGEVRIEVTDTGRGVAREHLRRLFEPFFTTKAAGLGSGLGLSICQDIVRSYQGRIEVESEPGAGSRFTVLLPRSSTRVPMPDPPPSPSPFAAPATRLRLLVVDDERSMRKALSMLLGAQYELELAESGAQALELLGRDRAFDAILCDLMMPELSGVDVHERLERDAPELAGRMIFLTGGAFTPRTQALIERMPDRHVEKPFEIEELVRMIGRVTAGR